MHFNRHEIVRAVKGVIYGQRGEPYRVNGQALRYMPGTRPVRLKYVNSANGVNRYDALQMSLLCSTLREGDVVVDIGAHWGECCIVMAALVGRTGTVIAFEPDPYAFDVLLQNIALNPSIKKPVLESSACSDEPGMTTLFSRNGNANSSLARSAVGGSQTRKLEEIQVRLITLDAYLADSKLPLPRWVKIDAEGAEVRILKGARKLLASNAGILCELHPYAWAEFGNTFSELKDLAAASGRRIRYLDQVEGIGNEVEYGIVVLERAP